MLEVLAPENWPEIEVPRVDADVLDSPALPAAYYRTVANRLRWELGGRLRLVYVGA